MATRMEQVDPRLAVDDAQVARLADSLSRFDFTFDRFDEGLLYPPVTDDPGRVANYFFFVVAIDHRTQRESQKYSGLVDGVSLHGSELLWALAQRRYDSDPSFFTGESMAKVTAAEIADTFRVQSPYTVDIGGPGERAALLRDAGGTLARDFRGSSLDLVNRSNGFLVNFDETGLLQLLKRFEAYSDPVSKKSFLLVKFLERRGFLEIKDPVNVHVPVDNVLQRVALRTGIVRIVDSRLERRIRACEPITSREDIAIRRAVSSAFDVLSAALRMNPTKVDDIFWEFGRIHCTVQNPYCNATPADAAPRVNRLISGGPTNTCPFGQTCHGFRNPEVWALKEPVYETTFY
jgi:hypothetical protein